LILHIDELVFIVIFVWAEYPVVRTCAVFVFYCSFKVRQTEILSFSFGIEFYDCYSDKPVKWSLSMLGSMHSEFYSASVVVKSLLHLVNTAVLISLLF